MIKHDWRRALGINFLLSIGISILVMYAIVYETKLQGDSVLSIIDMNLYLCEYMIVFAMATIPYAHAFIDDFERKIVYQVVTRTKLKKYVLSKTATIFVTAVLVIAISMLLFVLSLRIRGYAWVSEDLFDTYGTSGYRDMELWWMVEKHYNVLFYIVSGVQMGMLAGIVALVSTWFSLYVKNRMMITILPVMCLYIMYKYLDGFLGYGYGIYGLFNVFQNDVNLGHSYTLRAVITALVVYGLLTIAIYGKIKRMIKND